VEDEEQLKLQHDHLLLSLVQEPFVDRVQFLADTLMGGANADKLFGALCVKLPGKGFKIKLEADGAFCQKYPEVNTHTVITICFVWGCVIHVGGCAGRGRAEGGVADQGRRRAAAARAAPHQRRAAGTN
jgi:hypothetical protein